MADVKKSSDGPNPSDASAWDPSTLPDFDNDFVSDEDFLEFAKALAAPETSPSEEDLLSHTRPPTEFITALNDWKPVHQKVKGRQKDRSKKKKKQRPPRRGKDETREGFTYSVFKYPLLIVVGGWIVGLGATYLLTRIYIWFYEQYVTWRGKRQQLRSKLSSQNCYQDWVGAAKELDHHLGSDKWTEIDEYAYYDSRTIRRVVERMRDLRHKTEDEEQGYQDGSGGQRAVDELRGLVEACVKNNFAGTENPRLYSETYFGTKNLVQQYVDEVAASLKLLLEGGRLTLDEKRAMSKHLSTNFGRTALCLSGGATFAYYHFGIAKALLDADLLPSIITGTSGGALVAGLLATRTNEELKALLIPALAARINACHDSFFVWFRRWRSTGARFDSVDWAKRCAWFCRGSLTFQEAYERTGRILNVSCVPSDPHSPTILANYLTAPDCVIWSAVLASAAVPGILNPVVLMRKTRDGTLEPYSFGHKWKDGSLRTDIPLKSLNLHFNVNFSIVSQVNPHINLFFFSSRGTVGRPVTHRRGRGWRGGFLGSAVEQYLKLDLTKWLKVLRHLELLPRPLGQDWSEIWLQRFSGTITIWPKSLFSDFYYILSDPTMERLARMIHIGQQAAFPKIQFISNRMKIEKIVDEARQATRMHPFALPTPNLEKAEMKSMLGEQDLRGLLAKAQANGGSVTTPPIFLTPRTQSPQKGLQHRSSASVSPTGKRQQQPGSADGAESPSLSQRFTCWFGGSRGASRSSSSTAISSAAAAAAAASAVGDGSGPPSSASNRTSMDTVRPSLRHLRSDESQGDGRRRSLIQELQRQSTVFFGDDDDDDDEEEDDTEGETEGETTDDDGHDDHDHDYHNDKGREVPSLEHGDDGRYGGSEWKGSTRFRDDGDDDVHDGITIATKRNS